MDVKQLLRWASEELKKNKVTEPEKSAEFLLRQVLSSSLCHSREVGNPVRDRGWLIAHPEYELSREEEDEFREFIERRKKHEPVWYITGKIEFYGLDLEVNENVLIPRPETEFLVEEVLAAIHATSVIPASHPVIPVIDSEVSLIAQTRRAEAGIQKKGMDPRVKPEDDNVGDPSLSLEDDGIRILELGTGSGAISLALVSKFRPEDDQPLAEKIFASDISKDALQVAQKNAKTLDLERYIEFKSGDLFEPWKSKKFDIIVANLPYIPHEDMNTLALDIYHWEPRLALDGGKDGLEIYEKLIAQAKDYLNENAMMFFEIGIDQGEKLKELVKKYLPGAKVKIKKDYGDVERIAIISNIRNSC